MVSVSNENDEFLLVRSKNSAVFLLSDLSSNCSFRLRSFRNRLRVVILGATGDYTYSFSRKCAENKRSAHAYM